MKRAMLPAFIGLSAAAAVVVVYALVRGALARSASAAVAAPAPAAVPALVATPVSDAAAPTAEELRVIGLSPVKPGTRIVDFELEDLKGRKTRLSSLAGKVVFLNFWATWCPPCRAEMPSMERLHARLADRGLVVLAVDLQEGRREVEDFVRENRLTFTVLLDRSGSVGAAYGVRSIPTTFVIGRNGTVLGGRIGGQEWDDPAAFAFFERLLAR